MALDLENLDAAVGALERALGETAFSPAYVTLSSGTREVLRAGVIQCFEVAYEMCWKFMKRWLEVDAGVQLDGKTRRELFRYAAEHALLGDVDVWMEFHHSRNLTSHTYSTATADDVYAKAVAFMPHAKTFATRMHELNDKA
jgi:nucleotidyltransferase substrate binding protein (TIGR01987 family)